MAVLQEKEAQFQEAKNQFCASEHAKNPQLVQELQSSEIITIPGVIERVQRVELDAINDELNMIKHQANAQPDGVESIIGRPLHSQNHRYHLPPLTMLPELEEAFRSYTISL